MRKNNYKFLEMYRQLDRACCSKFGVTTGGVTEYINRLNNARFAPEREDVLPRLVRYRNIKGRFDHDLGAIRKSDELSNSDIRWLRIFIRDVNKKRDPISVYLRKARRYARRRKIYHALLISAAVLILALGAALWYALTH